MGIVPASELAWGFMLLVALALVVGCLKVIAYEYFNAVRWHNLRIECHRLRIAQKKRLRELAEFEIRGARVAGAVETVPPSTEPATDLESAEDSEAFAAAA